MSTRSSRGQAAAATINVANLRYTKSDQRGRIATAHPAKATSTSTRNTRPNARKVVESSSEDQDDDDDDEEEDDDDDDDDDEDDNDDEDDEDEDEDEDNDEVEGQTVDADGDQTMQDIDAEGESDEDIAVQQDEDDESPSSSSSSSSELEEEEDADAEGETDDEIMPPSITAQSSAAFSGTSTPDMSRMTKRQKSRLDEVYNADLMELPDGFERGVPHNKGPPETAEEAALKRAEMLRRRKNLTHQRLEEEKQEVVNRLLKRQAPKGRGRTGKNNGLDTPSLGVAEGIQKGDETQEGPNMARWVSDKNGVRLYIPASWEGSAAGTLFEPKRSKLIQDIGNDDTAMG